MAKLFGPSSGIPASLWALGFVSLLMDTSSELIHSLLPVFLTTALGASAFTVSLIESVAESTALIVRVFSGTLSDWLGRRQELAVAGYGLAALSKPLFAPASGADMVSRHASWTVSDQSTTNPHRVIADAR